MFGILRSSGLWAVGLAFVVGCATSGSVPSDGTRSPEAFSHVGDGFGFLVPGDWKQVSASGSPWVVRFAPAKDDASVSVYTANTEAARCLAKANSLLKKHEGATLSEVGVFTIKTAAGQATAWRGVLHGASTHGGGAVFCKRGKVYVLAGVARPAAFSGYSGSLERTIRSFTIAKSTSLGRSSTPDTSYFIHEVKWRGETLGRIAKWHTGKYENWKKLTNINGLSKDAVPLRAGLKIKIPRALVSNFKVMPRPQEILPLKTVKPAPLPTPTPPPVIGPKF